MGLGQSKAAPPTQPSLITALPTRAAPVPPTPVAPITTMAPTTPVAPTLPLKSSRTSTSTTGPPLQSLPSRPSETTPAATTQGPGAISNSAESVPGAQSALSAESSAISGHTSGSTSILQTGSLGQGNSQLPQSQGQGTGPTSPLLIPGGAPTSTFSTQATESLRLQQNPATDTIHKNSLSTGAIVGGSLAVVAVVSTIILFSICRRRRRNRYDTDVDAFVESRMVPFVRLASGMNSYSVTPDIHNRYDTDVDGSDTQASVEAPAVPFVGLASGMNNYPVTHEIRNRYDTDVDASDASVDLRAGPFVGLTSGMNNYSITPEIPNRYDTDEDASDTSVDLGAVPFVHLAYGMNSYSMTPEIQPDASAAALKVTEHGAATQMQEQGPSETEGPSDVEEPSMEENVSEGASSRDGLNTSGAEEEVLVLRARIRELESQMGGAAAWPLRLSNDPPPRYAA